MLLEHARAARDRIHGRLGHARVIAVAHGHIQRVRQRDDAAQFGAIDRRWVARHALQNTKPIPRRLEPLHRTQHLAHGRGAGRDDHGPTGGDERIQQRSVDDVGACGLQRVPGQTHGLFDESDAEAGDDGVNAADQRSLHHRAHLRDAQFQASEHLQRVGLAGLLLIAGQARSPAHEQLGPEQLELDGVGAGVGRGVDHRHGAVDRAVVIHAQFGDDVRLGLMRDHTVSDAHADGPFASDSLAASMRHAHACGAPPHAASHRRRARPTLRRCRQHCPRG